MTTRRCRTLTCGWLLLFTLCGLHPAQGAAGLSLGPVESLPGRGLPGEFERQDAILLSWNADNPVVQQVLLEIIAAASKKARVVMLVPDAEARQHAVAALRRAGISARKVHLVELPFDTIWTRDYGPAVVDGPNGMQHVVDADYDHGDRPSDDTVPSALAPLLGLQAFYAPLSLDGGNLLSNGAGLCISTVNVVQQNAGRGYDQAQVAKILQDNYGTREVIFLEPLSGEPTGHVDMFATFVSADTVVVGEYAAEVDPVNADILDRNAERLAGVRLPGGPLKVVRIPMPPHEMDVWRTYTNVLYANGTLLVPTYPGIDGACRDEALGVYRRVLPGWKIAEIDCSRLIELGGAIHCVTMNLAHIPHLPQGAPGLLPAAAGPLSTASMGWEDQTLTAGWRGQSNAMAPQLHSGAFAKPQTPPPSPDESIEQFFRGLERRIAAQSIDPSGLQKRTLARVPRVHRAGPDRTGSPGRHAPALLLR